MSLPIDTRLSDDADIGSGSETEDEDGSRKRKRPMNVTCEACKARKVRCDRERPACGWCTRNEHPCEYKERKKPGLRAGYGRELESRLDRLEAQLAEQTQQLAAHLASVSTSARQPAQVNQVAFQESDANDHQAQFPDYRFEAQQKSSANPTSKPSARQGSFNISSLPASEPQNTQSQNQYTPSAHSHSFTSPQATTTVPQLGISVVAHDQNTQLPPYDLVYTLVDLFFKYVNVWLSLLDRKTTLDRLFGAAPLDEADRVLLHAIVAVSLRFCRDQRLTPENRQHYHATSKQRVQIFGLENSSVRSLQAMTILALDVTGDGNGPPGWNLLALLSRSVVQLGLAVETTSSLTASLFPSISTLRAAVLPEAKTWVENEERRRLFWAVYLLDRYTTLATAFEFALDHKDIERRLPCRDELFAGNRAADTRFFRFSEQHRFATGTADVHGHFSSLVELLGTLSSIHQFLRRPIDIGSLVDVEQWQGTYRNLDGELNTWHFGLPDDFTNITRLVKSNAAAKNAHCGWITVHATYCFAMIRLNSSAAYPSQVSHLFSSSYSAMQRCLSAVDNMRQLARFAQANQLLDKLGPPFAFCVWVSARVTLVHGSTMDHAVGPDLGFFVSVLSEMGNQWDVARRYGEILSRVLDEYQQSRNAITGERKTPSTVRILADMRRSAYDLDFLISRQPHNAMRSYHPTRSNTPQPNELEYLDVFDLFNFPRLPANGADALDDGNTSHMNLPHPDITPNLVNMNTAQIPDFSVPNPQEDWLFQ